MKKIFLYSLMLLSALSFNACSDKDDFEAKEADRLFRPMFRDDNNTGKGSTDPFNCAVVDRNKVHLYWYTVDDAVGYEIKWAIAGFVANGEQAWIDAENGVDGKELAGHVVITDPKQFDYLVENLNYQSDYRFAIRALHSYSATDDSWKTDPKNSLWYGYGGGREWAEYLGRQTDSRYNVPFVIQVSDITKNSMHLTLNRDISGYTDVEKAEFRDHFNFIDADQNIVKVDYLTFTASQSTPNATENPTYVKYNIPESAWVNNICELDIDNLSENSCYNIDVWDNTIQARVDACYNSTMKRTRGTAGPAILIKHVANATDTIGKGTNDERIYDISQYQAMKLDDIIANYCADNVTAENQVYYLEGGKAYFFSSSPNVYKGFTLRTNPDDVAKGKRATLYLNGLSMSGNAPNTCNFMLGRQPASGENSSITLDIDSVRFCDLDVDCPLAFNYGDSQEGRGSVTGNYFMNMYPTGMGINVTLLEWNNCSFQGLIRGFFRIQGSNDFYIQHIKMIDCDFYNCGYYANNAGDYAYIFADHNGKTKSNILQDVEISGCVFYNNPKRSVITDNNRNLTWDASVRWHIDVHHNTFVNFCTLANNPILNTRYNPGGSVLGFHDNVIINTKDAADVDRVMNAAGWDTRFIQGGDGSGHCTFKIYNNWTTNDVEYLKNGQPFQTNAFNATSNAPAKWLKAWKEDGTADTYYPYGEAELEVKLDETLRATDLMVSPNPENFIGKTPLAIDYKTSKGIDGLYYKQTTAVLNSDIYKSGAGAPKLRNGK